MMKKIICLTMCLFLLGGTVGCSKEANKTAQTTEAAAQLEKVIVAEPTKGENWLPIFLAKELGFFEEQGLDVSFVDFAGGPLVMASLLAGESQFALSGYEQVLKTTEQGKGAKMIMATANKHPWAIAVAKNINSYADLKGQKVAAGMPGSSSRAFVRACLKYGGLDPDKDVQYVSITSGSELGAIENNQVVATNTSSRNKIDFQNKGYKILTDLSDPQQHEQVLGSKEYPLFVVAVSDSYIKEHPATVQKFTNAVVKGMQWQQSHSTDEIVKIIGPLYPNFTNDILVKDIEDTKRTLSPDGYFTQAGHDAATRLSMDVGMITNPVAMEKVVDESFLKEAHKNVDK